MMVSKLKDVLHINNISVFHIDLTIVFVVSRETYTNVAAVLPDNLTSQC